MTKEMQIVINNLIGKRVLVKKGHPRSGEYGVIKEFYPSVGITEKPGFLVEAEDHIAGDFFIFSGKEVHILPNP